MLFFYSDLNTCVDKELNVKARKTDCTAAANACERVGLVMQDQFLTNQISCDFSLMSQIFNILGNAALILHPFPSLSQFLSLFPLVCV